MADDDDWNVERLDRGLSQLDFFYKDSSLSPVSTTNALSTPCSFDAIVCDPPYNIGAPSLVNGKDLRPKRYHGYNGDESEMNNKSEISEVSMNLVPSILSIAHQVLVSGGRIVFFLPVRGTDMTLSLEEVLQSMGCCQVENEFRPGNLRLLKSSSRLQKFSPTFSRWLVCMEKC